MKIFKIFILLTISNLAFSNDSVSIAGEIASKIENLFYQRNFNEINKIDDRYRTNESRLPDGRWKITMIYGNFGKVSRRGAINEYKLQLELVDQWISETPTHPAPYIAKAEILTKYAWDARGSGWAKNVTEPQWRLFHNRISSARKILEDSIQISGMHPCWYLTMEVIAKAQNWPTEKFDSLYKSSVSAYPTYYFIHFRAADYYQPRWHGSAEELRSFVNNAVEMTKHREGYTLYTRIYWSQLWALKEKTFLLGYAEWKFMKLGFEDIMQDHPDSIWNLNAFAYYACMAKDWNTTNTLLKKISSPHLSIWGSKANFYSCKNLSSNPV